MDKISYVVLLFPPEKPYTSLMRLRLAGLTLLSALLIALAMPNELFHEGSALFDMVCLVPFWMAIALSPWRRFTQLLGVLFGVATTLLTYFWLAFFKDFAVFTVGGVALGFAYQFFILAPFLFVFARAQPRWRPFVFAAAWTCYEYLKSIGYLGFPWGLLAYPVGGILPLVQIADVTGVWGVSFLVAAVNGMAAESLLALLGAEPRSLARRARRSDVGLPGEAEEPGRGRIARGWAAVGLLGCGFLAYGVPRMEAPLPLKARVSLVLVQQNIDSWQEGKEAEALRLGEELTRSGLAEASAPPDLVVWSEQSFRTPYPWSREFFRVNPPGDPLLAFLRKIDVPLLTGSPYVVDAADGEVENAVELIRPDGSVADHYGKHHPVPFAEHIPFWEVPAVRSFMENVVGIGGIWTLGRRYTVFTLPLHGGGEVRFSTPICFEDSFPYLSRIFFRRGADFLLNLTDDEWSRTNSAEIQHFVAARYRAIENKRVLVRSSNSGVTAVVDPFGRVTASLPTFSARALSVDVPIYEASAPTAYALCGDWVPIVLAVWLFGVLLADARRLGVVERSRRSPIPLSRTSS